MGLRVKEVKRHTVVYEDGDAVVKFFVRTLPAGKIQRLMSKNVEITSQNVQDPAVNVGRLIDDKIDSIILDWEGVEDIHGNPLPCNRSNKLVFYDDYPEIVEYVMKEVDKLIAKEEKQKEKELKNLRGGPDGPPDQA